MAPRLRFIFHAKPSSSARILLFFILRKNCFYFGQLGVARILLYFLLKKKKTVSFNLELQEFSSFSFWKNCSYFSQLGVDQQPVGSQHLHLQPEDFPSHWRSLQTGRSPKNTNSLQFNKPNSTHFNLIYFTST